WDIETVALTDFNQNTDNKGNLSAFDLVVLYDVGHLESVAIRRLETHLRRGGGLLVFLGQQVTSYAGLETLSEGTLRTRFKEINGSAKIRATLGVPLLDLDPATVPLGKFKEELEKALVKNFNQTMFREGNGVLPFQLEKIQKVADPLKNSFHLAIEDRDGANEAFHKPPLQAFAANDDWPKLQAVPFYRCWETSRMVQAQTKTVLVFAPEKDEAGLIRVPALVEWTKDRGRLGVFTSCINHDWTLGLAYKRLCAMVTGLGMEAVSGRLGVHSCVVGTPLEVFVPEGSGKKVVNAYLLPNKVPPQEDGGKAAKEEQLEGTEALPAEGGRGLSFIWPKK